VSSADFTIDHPTPPVLLLIQDQHIRIVHAGTGQLLRELNLDPTKDYQPTGQPRRRKRNNPNPQ
jgi:hypothetical protein